MSIYYTLIYRQYIPGIYQVYTKVDNIYQVYTRYILMWDQHQNTYIEYTIPVIYLIYLWYIPGIFNGIYLVFTWYISPI